jgi:hypothetical protein
VGCFDVRCLSCSLLQCPPYSVPYSVFAAPMSFCVRCSVSRHIQGKKTSLWCLLCFVSAASVAHYSVSAADMAAISMTVVSGFSVRGFAGHHILCRCFRFHHIPFPLLWCLPYSLSVDFSALCILHIPCPLLRCLLWLCLLLQFPLYYISAALVCAVYFVHCFSERHILCRLLRFPLHSVSTAPLSAIFCVCRFSAHLIPYKLTQCPS